MARIWITGFFSVSVIAALKTFVVLAFVIPGASADPAMVSGLFALFFALTAITAYIGFALLKGHLNRQRRKKLAAGAGEPVAKETIVLRLAPVWGLSQAEADVAIFVAKGFSNSEIADMRGCAIATVKSQLGRIYAKSGLDSRYQLIAFVTDEVCSMASDHDDQRVQVRMRDALPLVGRARSAT